MEEEIKTTKETGAQETPTAEGEGEENTRKGEKGDSQECPLATHPA